MESTPSAGPTIKTITWAIYACYLASFVLGISALIGVIIAHIKRAEAAGTIYESHFTWCIRTFWIGIAAALVTIILFIIPPLAMLAAMGLFVWFLYRIVKGALRLMDEKPIENPEKIL